MANDAVKKLKEHELKARKRFGQNFLIDEAVLDKIIEAAALHKDDDVLEIGPGLGALTKRLAAHARSVTAVEIDRDLAAILTEEFKDTENVAIRCGDILKTDLDSPLKVVANLPYYITTPILMKLIKSPVRPLSVTVMVQKEVGERMCASPGGKSYGALSLHVQYYAAPKWIADVHRTCFYPVPKVDSAIISLTPRAQAPVRVTDEASFFALIDAAFAKRRKTLANAVSSAPSLSFASDSVKRALRELSLPESIRGEALSLSQFALLFERLSTSMGGRSCA